MAQEDQVALLSSLLKNYDHVITYQPLRTEVDIYALIPNMARFSLVTHVIPPRASLDPLEMAEEMRAAIGSESAVILIPGRQFDSSGTRHGQGGGWYDRFLANVPREWLRIGFCFDTQLSPTPLKRESWDQAMDYVVAVNRETDAVSIYSSESND